MSTAACSHCNGVAGSPFVELHVYRSRAIEPRSCSKCGFDVHHLGKRSGMDRLTRAWVAGLVGSLTTNALHELVRRTRSDAPRVDLLGMQALAKSLHLLKLPALTGRTLYGATFAADVVANAIYFSLVGAASRERAVATGAAIGIVAGGGAVILPWPLGLAAQLTNRTMYTRAMSIALYTAGGLAAGCTQRVLSRSNPGLPPISPQDATSG